MATGSKNGQTKKKPAGRKKPAAKKYIIINLLQKQFY